jgi:hypothetical protein
MRRAFSLLVMAVATACAPADAASSDAAILGAGLTWGQPKAEAIAALDTSFRAVTTPAKLPAGAGRSQDEAVIATLNAIKLKRTPMDAVLHRGTVLGWPNSVVVSFFHENRLHGLEVSVPPQRGQTRSAMLEKTIGELHRHLGKLALDTRFEVRRGGKVDVELSGANALGPEVMNLAFQDAREGLDAGTSHATAVMSFKTGRSITIRTVEPAMARGNPLHEVSAMVIDFKPSDPAPGKQAP